MDDRFAAVETPRRGFSPVAAILSGPTVPALLTRFALWCARCKGGPLKLGKRVLAVRHADVSEMLRRDLDFTIAPVNESRINAVNGGPFILGMDRSHVLMREREALYSALAKLDLAEIEARVRDDVQAYFIAGGARFDAIADYARPVAVATARRLFGIAPANTRLFAEVVRAIFAHTFLNVGSDPQVEARALAAAPLMQNWLAIEIARRRQTEELGGDLMGILLREAKLNDEGVRRTLGGMLVGSIDTTASSFARVFCVIAGDPQLRDRTVAAWNAGADIYGLCLDALRRWPHNSILLRTAAADTVLGAVPIKAGSTVIALTQAAMQDPEAFPDPGRVLPDRPMAAYLHYGAGLHPCAGRIVNAIQIPALVGTLLAAGAERSGKMGWAGPFPDRLPIKLVQRVGQ